MTAATASIRPLRRDARTRLRSALDTAAPSGSGARIAFPSSGRQATLEWLLAQSRLWPHRSGTSASDPMQGVADPICVRVSAFGVAKSGCSLLVYQIPWAMLDANPRPSATLDVPRLDTSSSFAKEAYAA